MTRQPTGRPSRLALATAAAFARRSGSVARDLGEASAIGEKLAAEDAKAREVIRPLAELARDFTLQHFEPGRAELFVLLRAGSRSHFMGTVTRERSTTILAELVTLLRAGLPDFSEAETVAAPSAVRLARLMVARILSAFVEGVRENPEEVLARGFPTTEAFRGVLDETTQWVEAMIAPALEADVDLAARLERLAARIELVDDETTTLTPAERAREHLAAAIVALRNGGHVEHVAVVEAAVDELADILEAPASGELFGGVDCANDAPAVVVVDVAGKVVPEEPGDA